MTPATKELETQAPLQASATQPLRGLRQTDDLDETVQLATVSTPAGPRDDLTATTPVQSADITLGPAADEDTEFTPRASPAEQAPAPVESGPRTVEGVEVDLPGVRSAVVRASS